jgi:hypothetical protein
MRRLMLLLGIIVAAFALGGLPSAVAANPGVNHVIHEDSFTDTDYCETGQAVDVSFSVRITEFSAPNQPVDTRIIQQGTVVLTNPLNGATLINHVANQNTEVTISGDPTGVHTEVWTFKGLGEVLRTEHGGVLTRDAGYLVLRLVLNGNSFPPLSTPEIVVNNGQFPDAETDYNLFCEVTTSALGLT